MANGQAQLSGGWPRLPAIAPTADLLLTGVLLVTGDQPPLRNAAVAIRGGKLAGLGPSAEVASQHADLAAYDASGYTVIPGLVNVHTHCAMGFFRGLGHGQDEMIESFFFPAEKALTAELLEPLAYSYLYSGLVSGTTCFGDHYYHVAGVARAIDRLGLRGVVGETAADLGGAFPGRSGWAAWRAAIDSWSYSSRVTPSVAPHAADTVSPAFLRELAGYAKSRHLPVHMHLAQSSGELSRVQKREGCSPVAYAEQCGALTPQTLAVHLVAIDDHDAAILARTGVTAGHCPASQILYERLAPIDLLLAHEIPVALGTDCAASNDTADMLAEMRLAALLTQDRGVALAKRSPEKILQMATANGARALGLAQVTGTLRVGMAADLVLLRDDLSTEPDPRPTVNVVFSHASRNVAHVVVDGRFVLYRGEPVQMSVAAMRTAYRDAVQEIHRRLGRGA